MSFADAIADARGVLATPLPAQSDEPSARQPSPFSAAIQDAQAALAVPASALAETKAAEPQKRSLRAMIEPRISAMKGDALPSEPSEASTQAGNIGAGATTSILAGIPGMPGDIANLVSRNIGYGEPFAGTRYFNEKLAPLGIGTASIPPEARRETAQEIGQGVGAMVGPNVLAKGRAISGILGPSARGVEEAFGAGSIPANAAIGAASGVGGYAGKEALEGTGYEGLGQAAGALIGGGMGIAGASVPGMVRAGYNAVPPLRASAQEAAANQAAAERFRAAATDPYGSIETARTAPREMVPGSLPTTGELTNDVGLLGAQRYRQAQAGSELGNDVRELTAANTEARSRLFQSQASSTASIEDAQRTLRAHLADLDREGLAATDTERRLVPDVAPTGTAAEIGERLRQPVATAEATERQRLKALRETIDPTGTMGMRPDAIKEAIGKIDEMFPAEGGAQLSGPERGLYGTVNSWGDLIPIERAFQLRANINGRIRGLQGSDPQEALRLGVLKNGVDEAISQAVNDVSVGERAGVIHQDVPPIHNRFLEVEKASNAPPKRPPDLIEFLMERGGLKDEGGELSSMDLDKVNRGYFGRLSRQSGMPLDDARELAAEAGYLHPDSDVNDLINALHRNQSGDRVFREGDPAALDWMDYERARRSGEMEIPFGNAAAGRSETGSGVSARSASGAPAPGGGALSARGPARSPAAAGSADTAGVRGISQEPVTPLTPEAKAIFSGWNSGYREMGRTYRGETPGTQHIVGKMLQKGGAFDTYRMADAQVAEALAKPGPMGAEAINRYRAAGGDETALGDALSLSFAKAAMRDGEIVPRLSEAWIRRHSEAIDAAGARDRFTDATAAQRRVEQAIADHAQARDEFNKSVAGRLIQDDPDRAIAQLFSGSSRAQKARELMQMTRADPAAQEGIRRAALDYIEGKLGTAAPPGTEVGGLKPERFRAFVNENRSVLGQLFPGRVTNFDALAADLERSTLVGRAKINKAGSDTAELTAGRGHGDAGTGTLLAALLGEHAGHHAAHLLGKVGEIAGLPIAITAKLLFSRAKNHVNLEATRLFDQMLLDPETAIRINQAKPFWKVDAPQFQKWKGRLIQQAIAAERSSLAQ